MEKLEYVLEDGEYTLRDKNPTDRMSDIDILLTDDISNFDDWILEDLEDTFSGKIDGFNTNVNRIRPVDDNHIKMNSLFIEDDDEWEKTATVIDKKQLYYLITEWMRLVKANAKEITITYDKGIYHIEGKL